jgi:uncharacterized protein (DUF2164 family)
MEFKVRALDGTEEKGVAQVEQELLEKHEQLTSSEQSQAAQQETPTQSQETQQSATETEDLDEQKVLSYIGKRYNKEIKSFDELVAERKESEELPEDVSAFLKYKKETGRGIEDFLKLNRDYENVEPDQLVREYLSATQEGLDDEDIDALMDEYEYDEDIDDESKVKKIKIERKRVINEAKKFFNTQKEKYRLPLESRQASVSQEDQEEFEAYREYTRQANSINEENERKRQYFLQKTDEVFSNGFKGFEFDVNNKKIAFTPGDASELKKLQASPENFILKFLDKESGLIKDAEGYHKSLAVAMNPEKFARFFYEQGIADATDNLTKKIKNVNMSERRAPEVTKSTDGVQVKAVNPDSGRSLKIRSIKRI